VGQRAALYCRVSTADQSCDRQERDLCAFAKRGGFDIVGVHKEKASCAKTNRIQRKRVSYRSIGRQLGLSKNTVGAIAQRAPNFYLITLSNHCLSRARKSRWTQ
jgi:DNA invertase Pin-like site-specific DNA recombinase